MDKGLHFTKNSNRDIEVHIDANWAGLVTNWKSIIRYCSYVWGNLVTWRSKKQLLVVRTSVEVRYKVLSYGICEGIWLHRMLKELKISSNYLMKVLCDNKATINIAKNSVHHHRTKHVAIDHHFIKEKIESGVASLEYTPSG